MWRLIHDANGVIFAQDMIVYLWQKIIHKIGMDLMEQNATTKRRHRKIVVAFRYLIMKGWLLWHCAYK